MRRSGTANLTRNPHLDHLALLILLRVNKISALSLTDRERASWTAGDRNRKEAFCRCLTTLILLSGPMEEETVCAVPISLTVWSAWALTHFLLNLRMATAAAPRSSTSAMPM